MKRFILLLLLVASISTPLCARDVISINSNWRFYFSLENSADYARTISLPHTWAFEQSNILISTQPTTANYLREIHIPASWSEKRIFVKFYGVQSVADVMVNGRYVGEHRGGAAAFTFELTDYLTVGESNRLHVIVNDAPHSDILPTSHEENLYGGIYRDVELIVTDKTVVSPLYYGSDGVFIEQNSVSETAAEGNVKVHLNSKVTNTCDVNISAYDPAGNLVFEKSTTKVKLGKDALSVPFNIATPQLWSLSTPNLYRFEVTVNDGNGTDVVAVTTGFRTIDFADSGFLKINGEAIQWRGVSLFHDYPHVGGAAQSSDIDSDMALINELGANAIRSSSHPHHPHLYDLCDEQGKMVWIDFPLTKAPFLSDVAYYPTERFHEHGRQTLSEIIAQNYNHPSVVMWGIFSLLSTRGDDSIPFIKEINALAKSLDATRPTVAVSDQDGQINTITDLIVWNPSLGWDRGQFSDVDIWSNMLHTRWSSMRSGVMYGQHGRVDQQSSASEYKSTNQYNSATWKPEGRQRVFHEEYAQRVACDSLFWGVCINTMFDYKSSRNSLGENNSGLVSFDRRSRKDVFYLYKAMWNKSEPTLHIADSRVPVTTEMLHRVKVYASPSDITPILYIASDSVEMRKVAKGQYIADSLHLQLGRNKIVVRQGQQADSVVVVREARSVISSRRR